MPANLKDLRLRIKSVKNTQQITKAMKLVSTARFGKALVGLQKAKNYQAHLLSIWNRVASAVPAHDPLKKALSGEGREKTNSSNLTFIFFSEKGLCGGFNGQMGRFILEQLPSLPHPKIILMGKKGLPYLQKALPGCDILPKSIKNIENLNKEVRPTIERYSTPSLNFESIAPLVSLCVDGFLDGSFQTVDFIFTQFQSAISQIPRRVSLFPLALPDQTEEKVLLEPDAHTLLPLALKRFMQGQIYEIICQNQTSEHAARMTAMDNATRNGRDMERRLQITYQRARQAAITRELIEIISGAEAL